MITSNLGRRGLVSAHRSQPSIEGTQSRNLERRTEVRAMAYSSRLAHSIVLYNPGPPTYLGVAPSTVGWAVPHQLLNNKTIHRLANSNIMEAFSQLSFPFPDNCSLCQVDKTTQNKNKNHPTRTLYNVAVLKISKWLIFLILKVT